MEYDKFEPNSAKYKNEKAETEAKRRPALQLTGKVKDKKKTLFERFVDTFVKESPKDVWKAVFDNVIKPAIINGVFDVMSSAYDMTFREKGAKPRPKNGNILGSVFTQYDQMFNGGMRMERTATLQSQGKMRQFQNMIFENKGDAEMVFDSMIEIFKEYKQVTLLDFYDLVGISTEHTDMKYGWKSLSGVKVAGSSTNGYYIDLPRCTLLEQ